MEGPSGGVRQQEADAPQAIPLLTGIETEAVIADKEYESNGDDWLPDTTGKVSTSCQPGIWLLPLSGVPDCRLAPVPSVSSLKRSRDKS